MSVTRNGQSFFPWIPCQARISMPDNVKDFPRYRKDGAHWVATIPEGESVVSMIEYRGLILVATTHYVFRLEKDRLVALRFEPLP